MIEFTPLGTAEIGQKICFRAQAIRGEHGNVTLCLWADEGDYCLNLPMEWVELSESGEDIYELDVDTSEMRGLYWYCASGEKEVYQLSVYDPNIAPPDWYGKGVTYHIFVDRFHRGNMSPLESDPDFKVHQNLSDQPDFLPNEINLDIYGGDLAGICEKLPYLQSLGVKTLYLSPIFEAWSNHKYNTADFSKVDSHFGDENVLNKLCVDAKKCGIRVILDGVFNHVGSDSVYFNKNGRYEEPGAWNRNSKYDKWFSFTDSGYESWWGIDTLPAVRETEESYVSFIEQIARKWLACGISGWRLDVADELPDSFLQRFYEAVKAEKSDALVIGEVWEDASNKIAYSVRRKYFTERELDGVMNYPLRDAILGFVTGGKSGYEAACIMQSLCIHYPKRILYSLMNHIGTHDTPRALSLLARPDIAYLSRCDQSAFSLNDDERIEAKRRLKMAAVLQYAFPGSPTVYYGDEAGMEGGADPFNRAYFPWGNEDKKLTDFYRALGELKSSEVMHSGEFKILEMRDRLLVLERRNKCERVVFCVGDCTRVYIKSKSDLYDAFTDKRYRTRLGYAVADIPEDGYCILKESF